MRECFNPLTVWGSIVSSWLQIEGRQQFEVPWHVHELCVSSPNYGSLRTHAINMHQQFLTIFFFLPEAKEYITISHKTQANGCMRCGLLGFHACVGV